MLELEKEKMRRRWEDGYNEGDEDGDEDEDEEKERDGAAPPTDGT